MPDWPSGRPARARPSCAERRWLVDALCGTLDYAVGSMLVAVNVALRAGSGITAAASADPFSGEVFWTDGAQAWVRAGDGVDEKLVPSAGARLADVNLDPPFPHAPGFRAVDLLAAPEFVAGIALREAAGCVVTGIDGEPVHTGAGGLVVAADRQTHDALLSMAGERGVAGE